MDAQEGIHQEGLKGIEQQENCCSELKSDLFSVKDHIEAKESLLDVLLKKQELELIRPLFFNCFFNN